MSNNVSSLKKSLAGLSVSIKTPDNTPIFSVNFDNQNFSKSPTENISLSVSRFYYEYIDDDSDECQVMIETTNPNIPDSPRLQEGNVILVSWGYINNMVTRVVRIKGTTTRYLSDKIVFELNCTDSTDNEKTIETKKRKKDAEREFGQLESFINYVNDITSNKIKVVESSKVIIGTKGIPIPTTPTAELAQNLRTGKVAVPGGLDRDRRDAPAYSFFNIGGGESFRQFYNSTIRNNMQDNLDEMPDGPWYINGQDDEVVVHNRDKLFVGQVVKNYTYRGADGDLLSFIPEVVLDNKVDDSQQQGVGDDGSVDTGNVNTPKVDSKIKEKLQRKFDNDPSYEPTTEELEQLFIGWFDRAFKRYQEEGVFSGISTDYLTFTLQKQQTQVSNNSPSITISSSEEPVKIKDKDYQTPRQVETTTGIDNTSVLVDNPGIQYRLKINFINPKSGGNFTESMINRISAIEQYAYTSRFRILGDPQIKSMQLINIFGVASKFKGKHYINRCKHNIDSSGYTVDGETIMQSPLAKKLLSTFNTKRDETEVGAEQRVEVTDLQTNDNKVRKGLGILSRANEALTDGNILIGGRNVSDRVKIILYLGSQGLYNQDEFRNNIIQVIQQGSDEEFKDLTNLLTKNLPQSNKYGRIGGRTNFYKVINDITDDNDQLTEQLQETFQERDLEFRKRLRGNQPNTIN